MKLKVALVGLACAGLMLTGCASHPEPDPEAFELFVSSELGGSYTEMGDELLDMGEQLCDGAEESDMTLSEWAARIRATTDWDTRDDKLMYTIVLGAEEHLCPDLAG